MTISIHQPNFFPHLPFFEKMRDSDIFVLLRYCQYEKGGYQNRFFLNGWHTMSVNRGLEPIISKRYINHAPDWNKIKSNLPQYDLSQFDDCISEDLSFTNTHIIKRIAKLMNIRTSIFEDEPSEHTGTERLLYICKKYGATTYLSGASGTKYMDTKIFEREGIEIKYQNSQTRPILSVI